MIHKFLRFLKIPFAEKLGVAEAWINLVCNWFLVTFVPFSWWSRRLGTLVQAPEEILTLSAQHAEMIVKSNRALTRAAQCVPFNPSCLVWSMTLKSMLVRHGVNATLHVGVPPSSKRDAPTQMPLHAWLQVGGEVVTGSELAAQYSSVVAYRN